MISVFLHHGVFPCHSDSLSSCHSERSEDELLRAGSEKSVVNFRSAKIQHPEKRYVLQCPPMSLNVPMCPDKGEKKWKTLHMWLELFRSCPYGKAELALLYQPPSSS